MARGARYVWQRRQWPQFRWDAEALLRSVGQVRRAQGQLFGQARHLDLKTHAAFIADSALDTSAIEGQRLDPGSVRSSVARRLGLPTAGMPAGNKVADGVVEMLLDASGHYAARLTKKRLCGWQAALFPGGYSGIHPVAVGRYRSHEMSVVSKAGRRETVHFEAPPPEAVAAEMRAFVAWFEGPSRKLDGLLRAAVAHFWFITIHPFDDGNGRVARAVSDLALAQDEQSELRLYSVSSEILRRRKSYYEVLEQAQRGDVDLTGWISWFLDCLLGAMQGAQGAIDAVAARADFWGAHAAESFNERQRKVLTRLLEAGPGGFEGGMTNQKYRGLTKTTRESAKRDLAELAERGVLRRIGGAGRAVRYELNWPVA